MQKYGSAPKILYASQPCYNFIGRQYPNMVGFFSTLKSPAHNLNKDYSYRQSKCCSPEHSSTVFLQINQTNQHPAVVKSLVIFKNLIVLLGNCLHLSDSVLNFTKLSDMMAVNYSIQLFVVKVSVSFINPQSHFSLTLPGHLF